MYGLISDDIRNGVWDKGYWIWMWMKVLTSVYEIENICFGHASFYCTRPSRFLLINNMGFQCRWIEWTNSVNFCFNLFFILCLRNHWAIKKIKTGQSMRVNHPKVNRENRMLKKWASNVVFRLLSHTCYPLSMIYAIIVPPLHIFIHDLRDFPSLEFNPTPHSPPSYPSCLPP